MKLDTFLTQTKLEYSGKTFESILTNLSRLFGFCLKLVSFSKIPPTARHKRGNAPNRSSRKIQNNENLGKQKICASSSHTNERGSLRECFICVNEEFPNVYISADWQERQMNANFIQPRRAETKRNFSLLPCCVTSNFRLIFRANDFHEKLSLIKISLAATDSSPRES